MALMARISIILGQYHQASYDGDKIWFEQIEMIPESLIKLDLTFLSQARAPIITLNTERASAS